MKKLESLITAAQAYRDLSVLDCHALIADTEGRVLHFVPAKTYNVEVTIGGKTPGNTIQECVATRKRVTKILPEHLYGMRLKVTVDPIIEDDGTVSGVVSFGTSLQLQDSLYNAAKSIAETADQMSATSGELATTAVTLAGDLNKVKSGGENVLAELGKTDNILRFVSEVANNSNLLGLNAAIEAARAGEQGRGFAVVAEEIRKMALNSSQSVQDIKLILQTVQGETQSVVKTIATTAELGERQAAATEELSATMQQLTAIVSQLEKIANVT